MRLHALIALGMAAAVQASPAPESIGAFLARQQQDSAAPLIQYCGGRVPELKPPLEREYARFTKTFRKATAPVLASLGPRDALRQPASPELQRQFDAMRAEDLKRVSAQDPRVFCSTLRQDLAAATAESIRRNMESAFAQFRAAVK